MPRKGPAPKRPLVIDPVYASPLVINTLMNLATSMFWYLGSGRISRLGTSLRRGMEGSYDFGFLAPYLDRACLRSFTPAVSSAPRTMW